MQSSLDDHKDVRSSVLTVVCESYVLPMFNAADEQIKRSFQIKKNPVQSGVVFGARLTLAPNAIGAKRRLLS
uniref:Uncharacterized protein n=1 Tax=Romanomermis culicivorax TaxID=13658 RepID=A0A915J0W0_ROMCU